MKKFILLVGSLLLIMNFIFYLVLDFYKIGPMISSQISLVITVGIIYFIASSNLPDGFRVALKYGLKLSGIIRFVLALFISIPLTNDLFFLAFLVIIGIELFLIASMKFVSNYSN